MRNNKYLLRGRRHSTFLIYIIMKPTFNREDYTDELMKIIVDYYMSIEPKIMNWNLSNKISDEYMRILDRVDVNLRKLQKVIPNQKSDDCEKGGPSI